MSLVVSYQKTDVVEYNKKFYFFRIADIYLENNDKIKYIKYLNMLSVISEKIQNFYLNTISLVYTEIHGDNSVLSIIDEDLLLNINNLNNTIINMLMIFQNDDYESDRYNSTIEKDLIVVYDVIKNYDFEYYMNTAFDEWVKISEIICKYLTINIKLFKEEDNDINPVVKFLQNIGIMNNKAKNIKQLTGKCHNKYLKYDPNFTQKDKLNKSNKFKNEDESNFVRNTAIIGGVAVAGAWAISYK